MNKQIPIIDIEPFVTGSTHDKQKVASQVAQACESIGFFRLGGHGIPENILNEVLEVAREFFDLPLEEKIKIATPAEFFRGYSKFGSESLSYSFDEVTPPDLKEMFEIGPVKYTDEEYYSCPAARFFFAPNQWPQRPAKFKQVVTDYYLAMEKLAAVMMRIFALGLELPENFFEDKIDKHVSDLTFLNYPEQFDSPLPGQLRAAAHTDYGSLSILYQDDAPAGGLQVLNKDGTWIDVKSVPGTFVVNIGDLMARWTNNRWKSTIHRVVNPPLDVAKSSRRQSVGFFHHPNYDALITCLECCCNADNPPKYEPITCGENVYTKLQKQIRMSLNI